MAKNTTGVVGRKTTAKKPTTKTAKPAATAEQEETIETTEETTEENTEETKGAVEEPFTEPVDNSEPAESTEDNNEPVDNSEPVDYNEPSESTEEPAGEPEMKSVEDMSTEEVKSVYEGIPVDEEKEPASDDTIDQMADAYARQIGINPHFPTEPRQTEEEHQPSPMDIHYGNVIKINRIKSLSDYEY